MRSIAIVGLFMLMHSPVHAQGFVQEHGASKAAGATAPGGPGVQAEKMKLARLKAQRREIETLRNHHVIALSGMRSGRSDKSASVELYQGGSTADKIRQIIEGEGGADQTLRSIDENQLGKRGKRKLAELREYFRLVRDHAPRQ